MEPHEILLRDADEDSSLHSSLVDLVIGRLGPGALTGNTWEIPRCWLAWRLTNGVDEVECASGTIWSSVVCWLREIAILHIVVVKSGIDPGIRIFILNQLDVKFRSVHYPIIQLRLAKPEVPSFQMALIAVVEWRDYDVIDAEVGLGFY